MIKVVVDTLGGDHSPDVNIQGAILALNKIEDLSIILVGDKQVIEEKLLPYTYDKQRLFICHAPEEISSNEVPTIAIKQKTNSSLYQSFELIKSSDDINAMVSIGSTGAIIAGAVLKIGRIPGVKRPGLCPILPTMSSSIVAVCDSGANADCDALQLHQFAIMSSLYLQKAYYVQEPKVALLNVGTEEEKGDLLRKEVHKLLKEDNRINFVGNMESRDLLSGRYDVVVCDGFSGNVLIKSTEGACLEVLKLVKKTFTKNLKTKIGALILKKDMQEVKNFMDYNNYGGAVLLGTKKTIVKSHGSSNATSIFHSIEQAYNMEKRGLREAIEKNLSETR